MRFMIVEHFRGGDARPLYERFRERGRLAPDGLRYVNSWVTDDLTSAEASSRVADVTRSA
jgi:hypothetical protein